MRTLPISSTRFASLTGLSSRARGTIEEQRYRSVIGALALCLFAAAYLVIGYRSPVTAAPVSSADAYRREIGSILSPDKLSPHTHHTLGLLPEATNTVRQSESVLIDGEYPTNGLTLALARKMRCDLSEFFDVVDPEQVSPPMVVIGHSMGGLLAKSLAVESGLSIWNIALTVAPAQLHASDEIRQFFTERFILKPWSQYPPMQAFAELPVSPRIPFYSILGSIGAGRLDGYVSVRCAHYRILAMDGQI